MPTTPWLLLLYPQHAVVEKTSPARLVLRAAGSLVKRAQPEPALPSAGPQAVGK